MTGGDLVLYQPTPLIELLSLPTLTSCSSSAALATYYGHSKADVCICGCVLDHHYCHLGVSLLFDRKGRETNQPGLLLCFYNGNLKWKIIIDTF